ncbi:MAG: hypothetical protein A3K18_21155 [Lentisphaerae bacterium RIFOXYA12_64_32]|nr:MAG: hypothetical protein A3K18_21155 [Lentisphaerae bacterium RIFOXYA12_64_32]
MCRIEFTRARTGLLAMLLVTLSTGRSDAAGNEVKSAPSTVRVAAVQCYSRMGAMEYNRSLLTRLVTKAAEAGAKIVVLPECAVTGYMDPAAERVWTSAAHPDENEFDAHAVAETVPGPATEHFAALAKKLGVYLCLPLVEKDGGTLYNSQVLLGPDGTILAHHRKKNLWLPGDGAWMTPGEKPVQVVDSPYGRLGLMICYDVHVMPELLAKAKADIVLYSVGWYGPNTENWFRNLFPAGYVVPNHFAVVVANWSAEPDNPGWPGHGYSCVIDAAGKVLSMATSDRGEEIVFADLPVAAPEPAGQ